MRRQREAHKGIAGTSAADVTTEAAVVKIAEKSARDCSGLHSIYSKYREMCKVVYFLFFCF